MRRTLLACLLAAVLAPAPGASAASAGGALTQLPGARGCLLGPSQARLLASTHCTLARGMGSTQHLVVSPDGRFAYAASNDTWGVVAFARNASSGALTQLPGAAGCLAESERGVSGCTPARGLTWAFSVALSRAVTHAWSVALSPDGRFAYTGVGGDGNSGIAVFRRRR